MQNRKVNLPSLGSLLTTIPLTKNKLCEQDAFYHCTFSQRIALLIFDLEILTFESGKSNHQGNAFVSEKSRAAHLKHIALLLEMLAV